MSRRYTLFDRDRRVDEKGVRGPVDFLSEVFLVKSFKLFDGLVDIFRLVVQVVVTGAFNDKNILLVGPRPIKELKSVPLGTKSARDAAYDHL